MDDAEEEEEEEEEEEPNTIYATSLMLDDLFQYYAAHDYPYVADTLPKKLTIATHTTACLDFLAPQNPSSSTSTSTSTTTTVVMENGWCPSYPARLPLFSVRAPDAQLVASAAAARVYSRYPALALEYNGCVLARSGTLAILGRFYLPYWSLGTPRSADLALLQHYGVRTVVDLTTEDRLRRFGVAVASSEKAEPQSYTMLDIKHTPVLGAENFTRVRFAAEIAPMVDRAVLMVLDTLEDGLSGVLVHCVVGYDRTPLVVSLVRISLWADGLVLGHLTPHELLYVTVAWDWMLFGHLLKYRLGRGEPIVRCAFDMVRLIARDGDGEEGSVGQRWRRPRAQTSAAERLRRLHDIADLFDALYAKHADRPSSSSSSSSLTSPPPTSSSSTSSCP
jgi:hypothetical protein